MRGIDALSMFNRRKEARERQECAERALMRGVKTAMREVIGFAPARAAVDFKPAPGTVPEIREELGWYIAFDDYPLDEEK